MPNVVTLMGDSQYHSSFVGEPIKTDSWFGYNDCLQTISIEVNNFTGRIYLEASLEMFPEHDEDWFIVPLDGHDYIQFPMNDVQPTGSGPAFGDTRTVGYTFKVNALWVRVIMDRSYMSELLYMLSETQMAFYGRVNQILLAR